MKAFTEMQTPTIATGSSPGQSTTHIVHAAMQFAWAIRQRMHLVVMSLVVCGLLGGLYYATATRYYAAKAELLVMQTGESTMSPALRAQGTEQGNLMPTFQNLLVSDKVIKGAIARMPPELRRIDLPDEARPKWVAIVKQHLDARAVHQTNIITVQYRSKDPEAAVQMVNALVESYLEFMERMHQGTAADIVRVLTTEKDELRKQLAEKEEELRELNEELGSLDMGLDNRSTHPLVKRAIAFNESLIDVQKKRVNLAASLAALENAVRNGQDLRQYVMTMSDAVGRELLLNGLGFNSQEASAQLTLERQMIQDQAMLQTLLNDYGENHPRVQGVQQRIAMTEQYLRSFNSRVEQRLANIQDTQLGPMLLGIMRQRLNEAYQQEMSLASQYETARQEASSLTGQMAQMDMLKNDITGLRDLYSALVKRITTIDLSNDLRTSLIASPTRNDSPVSPSLPRTAFMVILLGTGIGFTLVYVLDTLDDRFRSIEEMQLQLRAPVMAIVRRLKQRDVVGPPALQMVAEPDSAESEAFRTLRTALALSDAETRRIVITSTEPGDGKSTVAGNLAAAFAQAGKRTILIDGDLRRPGLSAMLALRGAGGLSGVLSGENENPLPEALVKAIRATDVENLDVLPAGPRPVNPAELLGSGRLAELLAWVENAYDQIIIDSPPILAASDTAILGRLSDGVLLVVQPDKNRRRLILRAAEYLAVLKIRLIGTVVNRTVKDRVPGYDGYDPGYEYQADEEDSNGKQSPQPPHTELPNDERGDDGDDEIIPRRVA